MNVFVPENPLTFERNYDECEDTDSIDRISKLPDEILVKILSCLPTKEAVATTILAKRWQHLWTLTSQVDISDEFLLDRENKEETFFPAKFNSFKEFVENVILHHHGSNIRKCRFRFSTNQVLPYIKTWICAVVSWNVQELLLSSGPDKFHPLPRRTFSCTSLVDLKIYGSFLLRVPQYVCLPCLKKLDIRNCLFTGDASMETLISSCPILEFLVIEKVFDCVEIMTISIPSLKTLLFGGLRLSRTRTVINAPSLEYFAAVNYAPGSCSVTFTSSLRGAILNDALDVALLKGISQVLNLTLKGNSESLARIISDSALPTFKNLKILNLLPGQPVGWNLLPNLLKSTPNLKNLVFCEGLVSPMSNGDFKRFEWQRPEIVPECLSTHVKRVEIFEFVGFPEELELVEYFLESCKVLEIMIIRHRSDYIKRPKMLEKKVEGGGVMYDILRFKRSSSCPIFFTDISSSGKKIYGRI